MSHNLRLLLVEDSEDDAFLLVRELRRGGIEALLRRVETAAELEDSLQEGAWDAVISDFKLPGFDGFDALRIVRRIDPDIPFILVSGVLGEEIAVQAMRAGAQDYMIKGNLGRLAPALDRELRDARTRREKRRVDEALYESEQRFRSLASNLPGATYRCRCDEARTMEYVSPGIEGLTGRSAGELQETGLASLVHPEDAGQVTSGICSGVDTGEPYRLEYRLASADGRTVWVMDCGRGVREGGRSYADGVLLDISLRKEMERELELHREQLEALVATRTAELVKANSALLDANAELARQQQETQLAWEAAEAANRAKAEFLANMSHEMRTPLTGVLGFINLVLMDDIPQDHRVMLEAAVRAGSSLNRLITDILDFSKLEAGKLVFEKKVFSLRACVRLAADVVMLEAAAKNLEFRIDIAEDTPDSLHGDEGRLRQVLVNLLGNAVKFTDRGSVALSVSRSKGSATGRGEVLFRVADTGVGIPEACIDRIFDRFTQADASTTRKFGGAGLGLAISRSIVETMGGRIWVEKPGEGGSVFAFSLPMEADPGRPAVQDVREPLRG
ncbi:MAG TPA: ATP-binding protein [Verrucomicrobiae bacterium]|nr:ATP-binding protein [Verrucomicrobiae bacterium]